MFSSKTKRAFVSSVAVDRTDRVDRPERLERPERIERPDRPERVERGDRAGPGTDAPRLSGIPSIISADMTIRGNLKCPGRLQIEGTVLGDIEVGQLVISDGAIVQGEIDAQEVEISGSLTGLVRAREITLKATARVLGDLHHEVLAIEPGAKLEGQCKRFSENEGAAGHEPPAQAAAILAAPTQWATAPWASAQDVSGQGGPGSRIAGQWGPVQDAPGQAGPRPLPELAIPDRLHPSKTALSGVA
jgi:cytoskeletal protein CcmA (bactofilin family)